MTALMRALLSCCVVVSTACSSFRLDPKLNSEEFRQHVLMFDARGEPRDPLDSQRYLTAEHTPQAAPRSSSSFEQYVQSILAGIQAHRARQADHKVRIMFFFHGGLNSRAAALNRAQEQILAMCKPAVEGGNPAIYPIFVNWHTSLYASYRDHLFFVTKGQDTYSPGAALWPFKLASDVSHFAFDLVPDNALAARDLARNWTYAREGAVEAADCPAGQLDFREGVVRPRSRLEGAADKTAAFVTYVIAKWWATAVIDAGGTPAWSSMIYTSDRLFYSDQEMHHPYAFQEAQTSGGGDFSHFLRALAAPGVLQPGDEIVLAAHSAGAIVANGVIQHFGDRLPIKTLVYMAPACTIDEIMPGGRIAAFLAGGEDRALYVLTLHEVAELSEHHFIDLTPRGSLLVWLDQFIQPKPSEFRGQTMGRARNLRLHAHLIPCAIQPKIHITAFSQALNQPQTHSDLGGIPYWQGEKAWRPAGAGLRTICFTEDPQKICDPSSDKAPVPITGLRCVERNALGRCPASQ